MKPNAGSPEPAHDLLRARHQPLDVFFAPRSVAVIGATENPGSVGRTVLWNLITNQFGGTVFPVNQRRSSVLGIKAYANIAAVPEPVDLAVIVTPAAVVPDVVAQCAEAGVQGAIIISAGFKEIGPAGAELERRILENARRGAMRIIGPNCLGVMTPYSGLNATFAHRTALPGKVGFLSQSGALMTAVLDWSLEARVGFSAFISLGSMLDVSWGDLIDYLDDDPRTQSIVIYMESIGDARSFLSAAREVALTKPVIVIKAGRTEAAAIAAASHTGSLAGSDEVLDAAFRRSGVLRVDSIADVFSMADVLSKQPRPRGPRLTIVTNAGGPGVLATDALVAEGGSLTQISTETMAALNGILPPQWSHNNPIDILGDAEPERYARALEAAAKDPASDGMLVILTPQSMTDPTRTAELLKQHAHTPGKPLLASWMGGPTTATGVSILNAAGVPTFPYPDMAARAFNYMWRYSYNIAGIYETPHMATDGEAAPDRAAAEAIVMAARQSGRTLLTEFESKQLLGCYGIPTVETRIAASAEEAMRHAEAIGYPVVVKLHSETITHKTDVGGVCLNLQDAKAVGDAYRVIETSVAAKAGPGHFGGVTVQPMIRLEGYELIVGSSIDAQFGPVLLFGAGGQLVEVWKDRALALPLLNSTLARRMMEQTRIYTALQGVRGRPPVPIAELEQLLVRFSHLVIEQRWIREIDINPLIASPDQLLALDARIVVHGRDVAEHDLPQPAIRPYPSQYVGGWTMKDGTHVTIRPIRPEDEPLVKSFHETLSEQSVYLRYHNTLKLSERVAHKRLARICYNDYDRELALVAELIGPAGQRSIVAIGRLVKLHVTASAELAVLVGDSCQRQGLGSELVRRLLVIARGERLCEVRAEMLATNTVMSRVFRRFGFHIISGQDGDTLTARLDLSAYPSNPADNIPATTDQTFRTENASKNDSDKRVTS
jgi:acetyltransferase